MTGELDPLSNSEGSLGRISADAGTVETLLSRCSYCKTS